MKIYDCFPFFNELDLLEIRLKELNPIVDIFVLVESVYTFQKKNKPLYFDENKKRFEKFLPKIRHIVVDQLPGFFAKFRVPKPWDVSNHQKNAVSQGLYDAESEDLILIGDVDEIPSCEKLKKYHQEPGIHVFHQRLSYYFVNCVCTDCKGESCISYFRGFVYWKGTVMLPKKDLVSFVTARKYRDDNSLKIKQIPEGGWHFSYLGGEKLVKEKLQALEHANESHYRDKVNKNANQLSEMMNIGADIYGRDLKFSFVPIDDSFPQTLINEKDTYQHLIKTI